MARSRTPSSTHTKFATFIYTRMGQDRILLTQLHIHMEPEYPKQDIVKIFKGEELVTGPFIERIIQLFARHGTKLTKREVTRLQELAYVSNTGYMNGTLAERPAKAR